MKTGVRPSVYVGGSMNLQNLCMHPSCVTKGPNSITFTKILPELLGPHGLFRK